MCLLQRELFLPPLQHSPLIPLSIPWVGTLASRHRSQETTEIVYLINATSREPEVGILAEMQQGREKKKISAWILLAVHSLIYMHLSEPFPAAASFIKPTGTAN